MENRRADKARAQSWRKGRRGNVGLMAGAVVAATLLSPSDRNVAASPPTAPSQQQTRSRAAAEAELARIVAPLGGEVGIMAVHLDSGLTLSLNANDAFPMASTFKIAVAGAVLAQVESGRLSLTQLIPVDPELVLDSEGIATDFPFPGVSVSIHNLIESMLTRSDNTATNVLVQVVGGAATVTAWVKGLGVDDMRIDGDTNEITRRFYGITARPGSTLNETVAADPALAARDHVPNAKFDDDPRDTTTPAAMVRLLTAIADRHVLSPSNTEVLMGALRRDTTGLLRLRAMLPAGIIVEEKTGTVGGSVNDVGIITLPNQEGRVAIAVYIKKSGSDQREKIIAQVGRSVYDYMLFESAR
jgi:beta-lactamase class A